MTPRPDTGSLAALLAQATGEWDKERESFHDRLAYRYALDRLAPDMASLLVDMAAYIDGRAEGTYQEYEALLARFAEIERRAAP